MRAYIQLFLTLLLPLSILFVLASIGYFTFNYDFSKAIKLGVLLGVLIGIGMSLIIAFALLILRRIQKKETLANREKPESTTHAEREPIERTKTIKASNNPKQKQDNGLKKEIKCMLLMDSALTFQVLLNAVNDEKVCTITASNPQKGTLTIQTKKGIIQTTISSLTQHTSQLMLVAENHGKEVQKLISHIKEKEHSFLQY